MNILEEFDYRRSPLEQLSYRDAPERLRAFREWLLATQQTKTVWDGLYARIPTAPLFDQRGGRGGRMAIKAATPEEIAAVGCDFITMLAGKLMAPATLPIEYNIRPSYQTNSVQAHFDELMQQYISPAIGFIRRELERTNNVPPTAKTPPETVPAHPVEITDSLARLRRDHADSDRTAFVMMRFVRTRMHDEILGAIRAGLANAGIKALRADDKEYHDDLFLNVTTYMHGCAFGIAVFERLEAEDFNPNVSLEVGYMQALRKPVCLLKDKTLKTLHVDLMGKLYRTFDPQSPATTIPGELERWLRDKGLGISGSARAAPERAVIAG